MTKPDWLTKAALLEAEQFDARPVLERGEHPRDAVLAQAAKIPNGGMLILDAPFDPAPLRMLLTQEGFANHAEEMAPDHWRVFFLRERGGPRRSKPKPKPPAEPRKAPRPIMDRMAAGAFLGGARARLLPISIPFRYFVAGSVFLTAFWLGLAMFGAEVPEFDGGLGPPLAVIHLLTLGVFAMTGMGATLQLLPVATLQALAALWPARTFAWVMVPGVAVLAWGMGSGEPVALTGGAVAVTLTLFGFALLIADNLRRTKGMVLVVAHATGATAALAATIGLGLLLAGNFTLDLVAEARNLAGLHLMLAAYGFMGLMALGFSYVLLPMLTLAPAPSNRLGLTSLGLAVAGLVVAGAGLVAAVDLLVGFGVVLGLGAIGVYFRGMALILGRRMRKRFGPEFILIFIAWACLPLSLLVGLAWVLDLIPVRGAAIFGVTFLVGWLLTFLLGILRRIVPFLASMHAVKPGAAPPMPSSFGNDRLLQVQLWSHLGALILVAAGIVAGIGPLVQVGGVVGAVGAVALTWFIIAAMQRVHRHKTEALPDE